MFTHTRPSQSCHELSLSTCNLLILWAGVTIGLPSRACAALNASVRIGELSVRIVMPMDMKKLESPQLE